MKGIHIRYTSSNTITIIDSSETWQVLEEEKNRGFMEKICIVRRRKRSGQGSERIDDCSSLGEIISYETAVKENAFQSPSPHYSCNVHRGDDMSSTDTMDDVVSINLTPEQTLGMQSSNFAPYLAHGISLGTALEVENVADDRIILHFHFEKKNTLRMLKARHVCEMLQISGSTLSKLVRKKKIRSFKIGRLRRFSVDDVLAYLAGHEDSKLLEGES